MELKDDIRARIPEPAQRVIDSVLNDLMATPDRDPQQTDKVRDIVIKSITDAINAADEYSGKVTLNYLSSVLFDYSRDSDGVLAREELEGLAQTFGLMTGQKEGDKYYPRALQLHNYGENPDDS